MDGPMTEKQFVIAVNSIFMDRLPSLDAGERNATILVNFCDSYFS